MTNNRLILLPFIFILSLMPSICGAVFDIEYLPADSNQDGEYESALGLGFYQMKPEGSGYYGNMQLTLATNEPHYDSLNIFSFGDPVTDLYREIFILNIGITRRFSSSVGGYLGIGYASATGKAQKIDPTFILSSNGAYYVVRSFPR